MVEHLKQDFADLLKFARTNPNRGIQRTFPSGRCRYGGHYVIKVDPARTQFKRPTCFALDWRLDK
jgi:hypothetical protein